MLQRVYFPITSAHNYLFCDSLLSHKGFSTKVQCTPTRILLRVTPIRSSSVLHQLQGTKEKKFHFASLLLFGLNIADASLKDEILRSFESGLHSSFDPRVDGAHKPGKS